MKGDEGAIYHFVILKSCMWAFPRLLTGNPFKIVNTRQTWGGGQELGEGVFNETIKVITVIYRPLITLPTALFRQSSWSSRKRRMRQTASGFSESGKGERP